MGIQVSVPEERQFQHEVYRHPPNRYPLKECGVDGVRQPVRISR